MNEVDNTISLIKLPEDVLYEIFSYLSISDLGRVAQVCRQLKEVSGHNTVWRQTSKSLINIHDDDKCTHTDGNNKRLVLIMSQKINKGSAEILLLL